MIASRRSLPALWLLTTLLMGGVANAEAPAVSRAARERSIAAQPQGGKQLDLAFRRSLDPDSPAVAA